MCKYVLFIRLFICENPLKGYFLIGKSIGFNMKKLCFYRLKPMLLATESYVFGC